MVAGVKAESALKRTAPSLFSTKETAGFSPSSTAPAEQDRHSLENSDSIAAHYVPDATASDASTDASKPAGTHTPQTVLTPPPGLPESPAQLSLHDQPAAAVESTQVQPPTRPQSPVAAPAQSPHDQVAAAVELTQVQLPTRPQSPVGLPAQGAAIQPASVQRLPPSPPTRTPLPDGTEGAHPRMTGHIMEPAVGAKLTAPVMVPRALPQASSEGSQLRAVLPEVESSISPTIEDVVAPTGCFHVFCCFKTSKSKSKRH